MVKHLSTWGAGWPIQALPQGCKTFRVFLKIRGDLCKACRGSNKSEMVSKNTQMMLIRLCFKDSLISDFFTTPLAVRGRRISRTSHSSRVLMYFLASGVRINVPWLFVARPKVFRDKWLSRTGSILMSSILGGLGVMLNE